MNASYICEEWAMYENLWKNTNTEKKNKIHLHVLNQSTESAVGVSFAYIIFCQLKSLTKYFVS